MQKSFKVLLVFFIMISMSVISCTSIEPVAKIEDKKEEMIITTKAFPETLDASSSLKERDEDIICSVFEGLVEITEGGVIAPALSYAWKISDDGTSYSFLLRDDIYWSDGKAIVADDFVQYFKYLLNTYNEKYTSEELFLIYGAQDYKNGLTSFENVGIFANGDKELLINLNVKDDNFLKVLTKPEYRLRDSNDFLDSYEESFENIRYTGAYTISDVQQEHIIIKKNKNYSLNSIGAKNIKFLKSEDSIKDLARFNTEKIDLINNPPITALKDTSLFYQKYYTSSDRMQYLVLNSKVGLGQFLDFRKGIYTLIEGNINDNYLIKNNFATASVKPLTMEEIEENNFVKKELNITDEIKDSNLQKTNTFFSGVPEMSGKTLKILAENTYENKVLAEFLKEKLEEYSLIVELNLIDDDELLKQELEKKTFDIFLSNVNTIEEQIEDTLEPIREVYEDVDYSVISVYNENNYWCKSSDLSNLYIDSNGNLILKKSMYVGLANN